MKADGPLPHRFREARKDPTLAVLEGLHALKHALRFGAEIAEAWTRDPAALEELARDLAPDLADRILHLARPTDPGTFDTLAPAPHPTGVIALAHRPAVDTAALLARGGSAPVVLLERPTHHGNIGAVVRVGAAAGAAGVLVTGPHDPWHPASLRGGAGLQFALPVASLEPDAGHRLASAGRSLVVLDPDGDPIGDSPDLGNTIVVFGSERTGVSAALQARADRSIAIPMRTGVSSLNLATAVATVLYLAGAPFTASA